MTESFSCAATGGGTGGHVIPALNICEELKKRFRDLRIIYIGANGKIEERLSKSAGYTFCNVRVSFPQRGLSLKNLILPFVAFIGIIQGINHLRTHRIRFVIGTGGYSAWPALAAAWLLGKPYFLHESNAYPGLVTRLMAGRAKKIFIGYEAAAGFLKANPENIIISGNPVKNLNVDCSQADVRRELGIDPDRKTILITGGSGGALTINKVTGRVKSELIERGYNLIWQVGKHHEGSINIPEKHKQRLIISEFFDHEKMLKAYKASDVVVARCGAMTLAELASFEKPAVLIPFPYSTGGHQVANGRAVEKAGAAKLILNKDLTGETLMIALEKLTEAETNTRMSLEMKKLATPNAAKIIGDEIFRALA